jgi:hypothetical protein
MAAALGVLGLLWVHGAWAAAAVDLYAAEAEVSGEGAEERNRAIGEAFAAVLVKLTGDRRVATRSGAEQLVAQAPGLVQQYRYRLADAQGEQPPLRYLWVRFDHLAVDRLLAERGWPVWRAPRPRLLVWLAVDEGGRRSLVNLDGQPAAARALRERAAERGLPLQLPLLDLQDQASLSAADLWSGFEEGIRQASQRYGEGPVLVGRLKFLGKGRWQPEWVLYDRAGDQELSAAAGALTEVLPAAVDLAADRLAARHAPTVAAGGPAPLRITVAGLYELQDYAGLLETLGQVVGVSRLALRQATVDTLVFDIWSDGSADQVAEELARDARLQPAPVAPDAEPSELRRLNYRWLP